MGLMASKRDPIREDVREQANGRAHSEAYPMRAKKAAAVLDVSRRTASRYTRKGSPDWRKAMRYAENAPYPERLLAQALATLRSYVQKLTRDAMIERYREALLGEPDVEAADRRDGLDCSRGWLDRAASSERDAGIDELKAALEKEFAVRCRKDPRSYSVEAIMREVLHG